jgi:hypothetical protein
MKMPTVEQEIKQQFARLFVAQDASLFKRMADYYYERAAFLRNADIEISQSLKLLARNCQKRLFIGIGTELLLKAIYLSRGFSINKIEKGQPGAPPFPFTFQQVAGFKQANDLTYMLNELIQKLNKLLAPASLHSVTRGLQIAKVFRNKEGHVVLPTHNFDSSNYRDVEGALVTLYSLCFKETLVVRFSVASGEKADWTIR